MMFSNIYENQMSLESIYTHLKLCFITSQKILKNVLNKFILKIKLLILNGL